MIAYEVFVEAKGYGDAQAEWDALGEALSSSVDQDAELKFEVLADETRDMLLVHFTQEAADAIDAHSEAMELWSAAWDQAFAGQPPTSVLAVRCTPAKVPSAAQNGRRP